MIKIILPIFFHLLLARTVCAQYPFDKYPGIESKAHLNWKVYDRKIEKQKTDYTLSIPDFFKNKDTLTIRLTAFEKREDSDIRLFRNKTQTIKYTDTIGLEWINIPDSLFVADFNGDSLRDVKFYIPNNGCGAYNYYTHVIYLFQKPDGTFYKLLFTDLFMGFEYRKERDVDGDGNYEIITQTFQGYGNHNYWLFNLYCFVNGTLINVNYKNDYPIMVQLLNRENFRITKNISREKMKKYAKEFPDDYKIE